MVLSYRLGANVSAVPSLLLQLIRTHANDSFPETDFGLASPSATEEESTRRRCLEISRDGKPL